MLPKENRLRKKKDIETVFKNGETFKESFLILKTIKNNLDISRVGFIVSKKVSKKATTRNKIKRRLREVTDVEKGVDAVLIALPGIDKKSFLEIKEVVLRLLEKWHKRH